jgi:2-haloacid dehalogenase
MRWVTFDCYGTLVDWHAGFASILSPLAGAKTRDLLRAYHDIEPTIEAETPHRRYRDVLVSGLVRAAGVAGVNLSPAQASTLPDQWALLPVFPDVEDMLVGLRAMGCRIAVLTNCDDDLFESTRRRMNTRFDEIVTADRVCDYKPALSHFRYFGRRSGAARADWVHVGCSWFHDMAPARAMGLKHLLLDRDGIVGGLAEPVTSVRSAEEVCDAVKTLFEAKDVR